MRFSILSDRKKRYWSKGRGRYLWVGLSNGSSSPALVAKKSTIFFTTSGFQSYGQRAAPEFEDRKRQRAQQRYRKDAEASDRFFHFYKLRFAGNSERTATRYRDSVENKIPSEISSRTHSTHIRGTSDMVEKRSRLRNRIFWRTIEILTPLDRLLFYDWTLENYVGQAWLRSSKRSPSTKISDSGLQTQSHA